MVKSFKNVYKGLILAKLETSSKKLNEKMDFFKAFLLQLQNNYFEELYRWLDKFATMV